MILSVLLIGTVFFFFLSCRKTDPETKTEFIFGTTCSITLYSEYSQDTFTQVFSRVREIENKMSVTIESSEVSEINRMAGVNAVTVTSETFNLITTALGIAEETEGALDITVGPLVSEWGIGSENAHVPPKHKIEKLLEHVDYRKVVLDADNQTVFLPEKGMRIDLGAIAKGYAGDQAVMFLRKSGVKSGIIDFGGNIIVFGTKQTKEPWKVGIQQPDSNRGSYFGILGLAEGAVVSSGTYERYFMKDGIRFHHIIDPSTGFPVRNNVDSVTIVAGSGTSADGYSTAVFVLGLERGIQFVENKTDLEAVFVTNEKNVYLTKGLKDSFTQTKAEYPIASFE